MNSSTPKPTNGPTIISDIRNSAVNTGKARDVINVNQNQESDTARQIRALLLEMKAAIPHLNLAPQAVAVIQKEVELLEAESSIAEPRKDLIQSSLNCVYGILIGVAGNTAYSGLGALIETVKGLIT